MADPAARASEASLAHRERVAALARAGRIAEARAAVEAGLAELPRDAALRVMLARLQVDQGEDSQALATLAQAEAAGPADARTWLHIGELHAEFGRWEAAQRALAEAARRDPGAPAIETQLAIALKERGDDAAALAALGRAAARDPGDLGAAVAERLFLPQVYASGADLQAWRARYDAGLAGLEAEAPRRNASGARALDLAHNNFLLAYQGGDDLALQRRYSRFLGGLLAAACPQWREPRPVRFDGGRRLRVGFASGIFRECTAGRYFERWVTGLDPRRFERFAYHFAPATDAFTRRIAAGVEHFAVLRMGGADTAARIAADALDVLVYPEVGMGAQGYALAALRLAPVQVAGWGHPVTTGSDAIDFYLTCGAMEPPDAAAHYAERLAPLPGIGVRYPMPPPVAPLARERLGIAPGQRLYVCAQSLFKVHPDMDAMVARLLAADERAVVAFFQAPARAVTERLAARLQGALAAHGIAPRAQLKFLPRMAPDGFRAVLAAADVVLDTPHFSGGNSSLDALAAGTPIVTLPGRFLRGRQTAAMLRLAGVPELVADDPDDWVRRALEAANAGANAGLRARIAQGRGALFDRPEPIAALGETLWSLGAGATPPVL